MKTVWKYTLRQGENKVSMPKGSTPLCVKMQHGQVCMWVVVDPNQDRETRRFEFFGTGQNLPDSFRKYIDTFFMDAGGFLVLHLFELL